VKAFKGVYSELLERYISFKRNLGYDFVDAEYAYALFDRFTIAREETEIGVTKDLADAWAQKRPNESDSTRYRRVMYLIHFSKFLNEIGYESYVPQLPRAYKSTFTPVVTA
jgi:integrase/recombinase XerD